MREEIVGYEKLLRQQWRIANAQFFCGVMKIIPRFHIDESPIFAGLFLNEEKSATIFINKIFFDKGDADVVVDTLLHEMIHQLQWETGRRIGHTPFFRFNAKRLGIATR